MKQWTAIVKWPCEGPEDDWSVIEEIDLDAETEKEAEKAAKEVLARDYEPGWSSVEIVPFGMTCPVVSW